MSIWSNYLWYFWVVVLVWLGACLTGKHTNSSLNMWVLEGSSLLGVGCTKESIGTYLRKCLFHKWLCRCVKGYTLFVQIFFWVLAVCSRIWNLPFVVILWFGIRYRETAWAWKCCCEILYFGCCVISRENHSLIWTEICLGFSCVQLAPDFKWVGAVVFLTKLLRHCSKFSFWLNKHGAWLGICIEIKGTCVTNVTALTCGHECCSFIVKHIGFWGHFLSRCQTGL